jgi:hypothetical protein
MELLIFIALLVALDGSSLRWGFKSLDGFGSIEWERRQRWYGFH